MSNSPYIEYLGIGCALEEISEQHNDRDEYGRAAILAALGERLKGYNSAIEYVEDLVLAKDDVAKDRAINRRNYHGALTPWSPSAKIPARIWSYAPSRNNSTLC